MYPPDTLDWQEHDAAVARAASTVVAVWPALVEAFGGSPEVAAMVEGVLREA